MPVTILNPSSAIGADVGHYLIETKALWSDEWVHDPTLTLRQCTVTAGGDVDTLEFWREYGRVKDSFSAAFANREPLNLYGRWVRLRFLSGVGPSWQSQGTQGTVFQGYVTTSSRPIRDAGSDSWPRSGQQQWIAQGGGDLLRRMPMSRSFWLDDSETKVMGWVPDMNARDERRNLVGNMTVDDDELPLYGGADVWSHYDYLRYIVERWLNYDPDQPNWVIAGELDALREMKTHIRWSTTQTIDQVLDALIPIERGLHYSIEPFESADEDPGFLIWVFALTKEPREFHGHTLPANPYEVRLTKPFSRDVFAVTLADTIDQQVDRIRVIGRRLVVCCSLDATAGTPTLVPAWPSADETAYLAGSGTPSDAADIHDRARTRFRNVFTSFRAPTGWDMLAGAAAPYIDGNGELDVTGDPAQFQTQVRRTLRWLPLQEGFDYTSDPPTDNNAAGVNPDQLPPAVWTKARYRYGYLAGIDISGYLPVEYFGVSVHTANDDWGVFLGANPAHILALNHWSGAAETNGLRLLDHEELVATIAIESDQRLELEYETDFAAPGAANTLVIEVPDAEYWILCPDTYVGTDADGNLLQSPSTHIVLRDDSDRLAQVMAGAIARYIDGRVRSDVSVKGILPWRDMIGAFVIIEEQGGNETTASAPITSITWTWGEHQQDIQTTIRSGFAGNRG